MWNNLLSGLIGAVIGAVIGGYLSYLGAIKAAEKTITALYKQDHERREIEAKEKKDAIVNNLLGEISENIDLADQNQIAHAKIKFITDAWDSARGNLYYLSEPTQAQIQKAYINAHNYNALVEYDLAKVPYGAGYFDDEMKKRALATKGELVVCKTELEKLKK